MNATRNASSLRCTVLVGIFTLLASSYSHADVVLEFDATTGTQIVFDPTDSGSYVGTFSFVNADGDPRIQITGPDSSSALDLLGDITGTYGIGAITVNGSLQTADVDNVGAGPHQFLIYDGAGETFSADVNWINITTFGALGGLNSEAEINLTNFSYGGVNADLLALYTQFSNGIATISFQFDTTRSLTDLTSGTALQGTSFSGSLRSGEGAPVVPEPGTLALLASAVPVFLVARLVRRRKLGMTEAA